MARTRNELIDRCEWRGWKVQKIASGFYVSKVRVFILCRCDGNAALEAADCEACDNRFLRCTACREKFPICTRCLSLMRRIDAAMKRRGLTWTSESMQGAGLIEPNGDGRYRLIGTEVFLTFL